MRIDGITGEILLVRSQRKSVSVEVQRTGKVIVRAPLRHPESEIRRFLTAKAPQIERAVQKHLAEMQQADALTPYTRAEIEDMAQRALEIIPPRVAYYAEKLGVTYGRITIRNQKTRWGSCTAQGNLNFNCLLVEMPPEVLDSVVAHELCHRLHLDHSKAFYADLYRIFPEYDRCSAWLKEHGGLYILRMTGGM